MLNGVGSNINNIQYLKATQAFKAAVKENPKTENLLNDEIIQDRVEISSENTQQNLKTEDPFMAQKKEYINEFKNYIGSTNEFNFDDEDIKYALKYGESILVNQMA